MQANRLISKRRSKVEMKTLDNIGIEEGSDRSSRTHNYLNQYETFIQKYRNSTMNILEIGGRTSASARLWTRFFPNATLHVIDTHPTSELYSIPRVKVLQIDNYSKESIAKVAEVIQPTLALDDGTHKWSHQMAGLHSIFPSIKPGGLFIIEDLQTSFGPYEKTHGDTDESTANFLLRFASGLLAGTLAPKPNNTAERYLTASIDKISFIRQAAILHKKTTSEFLYTRNTLDNTSYTLLSTVKENESYSRVSGEILHASPSRLLSFQRILDAGDAQLGPSTSGVIRNICIHGGGLGVTNDGIVLSETLNNIENIDYYANFFKRVGGSKWQSTTDILPEYVGKIPGRQHVLLKGAWDSNYGHWLYDVLARLQNLKDLNLSDKPLLIISPRSGDMSKVVYETLKLSGFNKEDIIEHDVRPRRYESLVVLGRMSRHPLLKSPAATEFLVDMASEITTGTDKRIYLSRNAYSRRRLTNEELLRPILEAKGFRIVYPEQLDFREQVSLLKGAEIVAGNMGAAFTSLAFSPMKVKALTLSTPGMPHDFFYDIVCHKKGEYIGIQGTSKESSPGMGSDFEIAEEHLLEGLAKFGL